MEYANHLKEYAPAWSASQVDEEDRTHPQGREARNHNTEVYKFCYSPSTSRRCRATIR